MKFLLIGHFALDVVLLPEAAPRELYGGIFHAVRALASSSTAKDTILPVFGVAKADQPAVLEALGSLPGVDTAGVFTVDEPTPRVYHRIAGDRYAVECSPEVARPIPFEKLKRHLEADGILVNMVSGRDITLETMDEVRMAVRQDRVPIHFDFHNLTLGFGGDHRRLRVPLPEWRRWAFMAHSVQLNEEEIAGLTVERLPEEQTAGHFLTLGVRGVVVTRGGRGATLYTDVHKRTARHDCAGDGQRRGTPVIGAGDVFGASFLYEVVKGGDLVAALPVAHRTAAAYAETEGEKILPTGGPQ